MYLHANSQGFKGNIINYYKVLYVTLYRLHGTTAFSKTNL